MVTEPLRAPGPQLSTGFPAPPVSPYLVQLPAPMLCDSRLPVTSVPGDLTPDSGLPGHCIHAHACTHTHAHANALVRAHTHAHIHTLKYF